MANNKHAFQGFNKELMARALGRDLSISTKQAIEICNYLRKRKLSQAKALLEKVLEKKQAVPFKRFTNGLGHRPGKMGAGRYPQKAAKAVLSLLESVEANAQTKGLNTNELEIIHICAHKAHSPVHYGRHHGREFKRTHVEVVVQETPKKEKAPKKEKKAKPAKPAETKPEPKAEKAPEEKPQVKPEEKKEEPAAEPDKKEETHDQESKEKPEDKK